VVVASRQWSTEEVGAWFAERIPSSWFDGRPEVRIDREEILVVGVLRDPCEQGADGDEPVLRLSHVEAFRDGSRERRVAIADAAETMWGRKVSWGVRCGGHEVRFTTTAVPVMTRLRMEERAVLDTLIDAGVARSRSEALAWCVRLVARHEGDWIDELRTALDAVAKARAGGPELD
jgi:hypothetical protein